MRLRELLAGSSAPHRHAVARALGLDADAPAARIAETLGDEEHLASVVAELSSQGRAAATAGAFAGPGAVFHTSPRADATGVLELERHGLAYAFGRSWARRHVLADDLLAPLQRVRAQAHAARVPDEPPGQARFVGAPLQLAHDAAVLSAFMAREPVRVKADGDIYARTRPKLETALGEIDGLNETALLRVDLALDWLRDEGLLRLRVDDLAGREARRELVPAGAPLTSLSDHPAALSERLTGHLVRYDEVRCLLPLVRALGDRERSLPVLGEALEAMLGEAGMLGHHAMESAQLALSCAVPLWLAGELELGLDPVGAVVAVRRARPEAPPADQGPLGVAQGNFELVLLRRPSPGERALLELCCERTAGQEHVYTVTRAAARAAQRAPTGPQSVADALAGLVGELPQNVERSLRDWTRDVRAPLRLRSAMLVDVGDGATAEALAGGALDGLVVERMGERMLAVPADRLDEVAAALEGAGAALEPGLERVSGAWEERVEGSLPARARWDPIAPPEPMPHAVQVSTLEDGPPPGAPDVAPQLDPTVPLEVILDALERDIDVAIVYAGARGVTHRVVTPIEVDASRVHGYCHLRDDERSFWLASILVAQAVEV
ncbi:MAG: hypothetical protein MSC31_01910 [Solirubrobacteraceae bacterium MAG38_C4-C5]|nr:hypothetical protein [Candidatus Siliceabacter maunaloa]